MDGGGPPDVSQMTGDQIVLPVSPHAAVSSKSPQGQREEIFLRVLRLLEVEAVDFDAKQPLITYGLDSISAARLVSILRPFAIFSQLQLLGGITWSEMESKLVWRGGEGWGGVVLGWWMELGRALSRAGGGKATLSASESHAPSLSAASGAALSDPQRPSTH